MNMLIKQRLFRILNLCLDAKDKGHDVFFEYSPHVQGIEIRIYENGWEDRPSNEPNPPSKSILFYLDKKDVDKKLQEAEEHLKGLLK